MNEVTEIRTPGVIATEINSIKGQTRAMVLHASAEIGKRLVEAKELVAHGEWSDWLKNNIDYSQSTANNLMQLYREYGSDLSKFPTLGNMSYTKALALLGVPEDEREQFVEDHDVEQMSARELQKVIKEKQKLEKELEKKESAAEKERKKAERLEKELEEAKWNQKDQETVQRLTEELKEAQSKVTRLEADLKSKPIEATTIEVIPEEVEKELELLRNQVAQQEQPAVILEFRIRFEQLVEEFKHLLEAIHKISNEEEQQKYKGAVAGLIEKMKEKL